MQDEIQSALVIAEHYEKVFAEFGDTFRGADWPKESDVLKRYEVMLGIIPKDSVGQTTTLLDFGCGSAQLMDHIGRTKRDWIQYSGMDVSESCIKTASEKYPKCSFYCNNILTDKPAVPPFDYVVMNGVLTEKLSLSQEEMLKFTETLLVKVFEMTAKGMAFNVMSKIVDWERPDLFHLSMDAMSEMIGRKLSRHFVVRHDYGLYEYTVYIYKTANQ
ncbi:MAG: class I SAM-dependent methyltransferase [Prosthecobacter sp.]|uniref:class I SAM-dependent methyltransferase n=1 Tax=Prosthecobacter sp. TaxID=1965333 RepID=UPI0025F128B1|nr:class I SAM-dependent methyltransferase [Prosthecobacter sp.]MCF7787397.1 class I SAM-dependent methyltransferase [Prosthecobacter sp.]